MRPSQQQVDHQFRVGLIMLLAVLAIIAVAHDLQGLL